MIEQVSDTDWCMMRQGGEPITTVDFCNGAVMTFDDNGKMTSRKGGLFGLWNANTTTKVM